MTARDDGGPAFPVGDVTFVDPYDDAMRERVVRKTSGMSLRDYFAAQATACLWHHNFLIDAFGPEECALQIQNAAALAYRIADALLAERALAQPASTHAVDPQAPDPGTPTPRGDAQ